MNRIDLVRPDAPALARRGPCPVGVRTEVLTDPDADDARALVVELWYPAQADTPPGCSYATLLRDGHRAVTLNGSACRGAQAAAGVFPLVILSHGWPGNRYLMAHFAEHLASHGYRVAAIDHSGSTYEDKQAFAVTLIHRPGDIRAVARALGGDHAVIGYSMGGYGALVAGGAGVSEAALTMEDAPPAADFAHHRAPAVDPALKAILPIGPWGRQRGLWDAAGLAALRVPMLLMAGEADVVSGYSDGMRLIFDEACNVPRWLLTFERAGHNAAAPIPAPVEAWEPSAHLEFIPFAHYADPVWDSLRMNDIARHYARAFLDLHLKGDDGAAAHLVPGDWPGFDAPPPGLRLEAQRP